MEKLKGERLPERTGTVLGAESAFSCSGVDTAASGPQPLSANVLVPGSKVSREGFSGFKSPDSEVSSEEGEIHDNVHEGSVLLQGAINYGLTEDVSEEIDKQVAAMVNHLFVNGMREEDYKDILEDGITKRPSNCQALSPVECNAPVLGVKEVGLSSEGG